MESSAHVRPCPAEGLDRRLLVDPEVRLLVDPSVVRLMLGHLHQRLGLAMVLEVVGPTVVPVALGLWASSVV